MPRLAYLLLPLALCAAQPAFELRGTVVDAVTSQPIQEADVDVIPGNGLVGPGIEVTKLKTDSQGSFLFRPEKGGQYVVRVRKEGFTRVSNNISRGVSDQGSATLSEQKPSAEFHFSLQRGGRIAGTIVDADTDRPIPNFRFELAAWTSTNGQPFARGGTFNTGPDGTFERESPAGEYLVATVPQVPANANVLATFTNEDTRAKDLDYTRAFFPAGPNVETALPISLSSGALVNVGAIRVRKQELNRVLVDLDRSSCPEGQMLNIMQTDVFDQGSNSYPKPSIPCGPFLLTHMVPGRYLLALTTGTAPNVLGTSVVFTVTGSNFTVPARLGGGTTLTGTVVPAEGVSELPLKDLKVSFAPVSGGIPVAEVQPHDLDEKGRFQFPGVRPGRRRAVVAGLGNDYYVKEVRIAKTPAPGNLFDYSGSGELEIEIGKSPATVSGAVIQDDKPVPGADVVLLRWPTQPGDDREAAKHIAADAEGRFRISGIVPGEYRLFAVPAAKRLQAERPAPWQRLTQFAEPLRLTPGANLDLRVPLKDPDR